MLPIVSRLNGPSVTLEASFIVCARGRGSNTDAAYHYLFKKGGLRNEKLCEGQKLFFCSWRPCIMRAPGGGDILATKLHLD